MSKLEPCPFCGREVCISKIGVAMNAFQYIILHKDFINDCRAFMESTVCIDGLKDGERESKKNLIKSWNRRVKE